MILKMQRKRLARIRVGRIGWNESGLGGLGSDYNIRLFVLVQILLESDVMADPG